MRGRPRPLHLIVRRHVLSRKPVSVLYKPLLSEEHHEVTTAAAGHPPLALPPPDIAAVNGPASRASLDPQVAGEYTPNGIQALLPPVFEGPRIAPKLGVVCRQLDHQAASAKVHVQLIGKELNGDREV